MNQVISFVSTKVGVGKTIIAANLAGYLKNKKYQVLMVDADPPQPSLSSYFQITTKAKGGLTEALKNPKKINECTSRTAFGDLIYANDPENRIQHWLASEFLKQTSPLNITNITSLVYKSDQLVNQKLLGRKTYLVSKLHITKNVT